MFDIISIGAAVKDVFLFSEAFQFIHSNTFEGGVGQCVSFGSKLEVDRLVQTSGGGATNSAVTFARLGFDTGIVCRLGEDADGNSLEEELAKEGVDTALIRRVKKETTGYSVLLTASNGERSILTHRGASGTFHEKDIPTSQCLAKAYYVTSLAGNLNAFSRIVKLSDRCKAPLAWNPGHKELSQGMKALEPLLPSLSVLILNLEEARLLTGDTDARAICKRLSAYDLVCIITDGERGAYACVDGTEVFFAKTRAVEVRSRTGAGDAFGSGVFASLLRGDDIETALAVGMINAESVIAHIGAKAGILNAWPKTSEVKKIEIKSVS